MTELLGQVPVNLISLGVLGALGLRKLMRMEGHHWLRVVILTGLLWVVLIFLCSVLLFPSPPSCVPTPGLPEAFTITEV